VYFLEYIYLFCTSRNCADYCPFTVVDHKLRVVQFLCITLNSVQEKQQFQ